ncbi:MAG TPA: adenylate/guanylate cyclase domain-containing protein [Dehalococcoidia bacterium]|nr:adenylate/guanylate cyclase domain-containing protein [Dehalococcoidia bacterium]
MEPRIQYAKTSDGVSIAFWTLGEGTPLVWMASPPFSHIQLEWQLPEWRLSYERLAHKRRLVRYDGRGSGLSERHVTEFPLEAHLLDLEAVIDRLGLERFALLGYVDSGPAAITYAARHPERVSHLVLWASYARASDQEDAPETVGLRGLTDQDWRLFTETLAHTMLGWSGGEAGRRAAEFMRECTTPEAVRSAWRANSEIDVTALLPQVTSPTLVLHAKRIRWSTDDISRGLASQIPDARLTVVDGISPLGEEAEAVLTAIDEFLGEGEETEPKRELPEGMAVILFADIAESTALTERLGDAPFRGKARDLDTALRAIMREHSGTPIEGKLLGDGVLAVFTSARQAIEAALACGKAGEEAGLPLHLGIHAGDVIREENNVYGGAVNIAARISALSAPGEVLVSETVRGLARTSAGVSFENRGEQARKGVSEPVRVWAVREGEGP